MIARMECCAAMLALEHLPEGARHGRLEVHVKRVAAALEGAECTVNVVLREIIDARKRRQSP